MLDFYESLYNCLDMDPKHRQLPLNWIDEKPGDNGSAIMKNGLGNRIAPEDKAFHSWYRFVLSYPPHLVSHYLADFGLKSGQTVLDPFCGTGTTLVEARLNGFAAVGIEANPFAQFASSTKLDWEVDPASLVSTAEKIAAETAHRIAGQGIDDLQPADSARFDGELQTLGEEEKKLILADSISPLPLHKTLELLEILSAYHHERCYSHLRLALAKALVFHISNLHFGPEVGVGKPKRDAVVISTWLGEVKHMAEDLRQVQGKYYPPSIVHLADARSLSQVISPASVDAVITSPPYPNEKDYTRTTRLESVLLGFIKTKQELRGHKKNLVRSNTRSVYKEDDDDQWIVGNNEIQGIADAIENRRIELGKTSGFERQYARLTKLYFGGMARHLSDLRAVLRPGARLAYVVGDQASYLRVMIRTGQLLADIAQEVGYEVARIDLFRKRFATATRQELREEVVVLRWKGL